MYDPFFPAFKKCNLPEMRISYCAFHQYYFCPVTNITCSPNCTWSFTSYACCTHECIGTLIHLLWLYFMQWNCMKHATNWRCHKRKKNYIQTHLTIWRSASIIFLFHIFSTFFFSFLFPSCSLWCTLYAVMAGKRMTIDRILNMHMHAKHDDIITKLCIFCGSHQTRCFQTFLCIYTGSSKGCRSLRKLNMRYKLK